MSGHGEGWFTALPDCEAALAVASRVSANQVLKYASGRPLLMGEWGLSFTWTNPHGLQIILLGHHSGTESELRQKFSGIRSINAATDLLSGLAGDFHAIVAGAEGTRVQGTASGLRRVFHTRSEGLIVASNRSDVLAHLVRAPLDEELIAVRLLDSVPHPLGDLPLWRGVHSVPPGYYLAFGAATSTYVPWWVPPDPQFGLSEGAFDLRDALVRAVGVRTAAVPRLSSDLSGGLDSTAICALAARAGAAPIALTMPSRDPGDDDLYWAKLAGAEIDTAEHIEVPLDEIPLFYSGLLEEVTGPVDEPLPTIIDQPRQLAGHHELLAHGCQLHLTGMGGDHVLWGHPAHIRDLVARNPFITLHRIRGYQAQNRWSARDTLTALLDRRPYGQWLSDIAEQLGAPRQAPHSPDVFAWDVPPRLPSWTTPDAVSAVRRRLKQEAATAVPRGTSRAMHNELNMLHHGTRATRILHHIAEHHGLPLASPFFDDRVIEACWSVKANERTTPWEFKPLLKVAMRDLMPTAVLERTTKGEASADAANGLRENRGKLLDLWQESQLADFGLVDKQRLVELTLRPSSPELRYGGLDSTLACEIWLRTI